MKTTPSIDERSATLHSSSVSMDEKSEMQQQGASVPHSVENTPQRSTSPEVKTEADASTAAALELKKIHTSDEGVEYPTGMKLVLITLALCLSVFLMALDNTIIATAIPKITDEFNSLSDIGWYGSAYLLTTAAFQLLFGKFYSFFSIKIVYLIAISIFELGSLICGVAPNSNALIIGRAIAGLGSAGIFSGALIIVAYSVPLRQRPMYTGFIGAMYGIASVAGPLLGGVFTDKATWRWCFYINLPIGAVTIGAIAIFFKAPGLAAAKLTWRERANQLDLLGTFFFMPAVISLLLALQWGGSKYDWNSGRIIALFVVSGVLIIAFGFVQFKKQDYATVPPRIISQRTIWASSFYSFCLGSSFFILMYYLPIWFQAVQGTSAVDSGIRSLPLVLGLVLVSILSGIAVTLLGYYTPLMITSSILMAVGFGLLTTFTPDTPRAQWIGYQALAGMGVGFGMQQPLIAVQTVLDISDVPVGTALLIFLQTMGGALFVSVGQNVFTNKLISGLMEHAPGVDSSIVLSTGATSIQKSPALQPFLEGVTIAYNNALTSTYTVATALAAASIIGALAVEWKSVKGKKVEMAMA